MSRLIRYDDAIERLGAYLMASAQIDYGGTASTDIEDWKKLADMILNGVPTIDAVSVVRCKDCRFGTWDEDVEMYDCVVIDGCWFEAHHYCSYGERKESE